MHAHDYDVIILGAGLAGLTLARQLSLSQPGRRVAVIEHRQFPMQQAAHKVGESTVEIASHYFAETLGLHDHLKAHQLPKFGLRLFLRGERPINDDLARYDEIGASQPLPIATYQLDRGTFENHLAELIQAQGVDLLDGATVRDIDLTPGQHRVRVRTRAGQEAAIQARFLVDTSGRRAFLRSKQDLKKPARHDNHALWFRVQGELDLDQWSSDRAWRDRCQGTPRRLSTNHFSGPGYWLWLIPLAGGYTSVGLVFDPKIVDPSNVRKHDALLRWLEAEHPLVAAHLGSLPTLDFHYLENYAASCRQVFSSEGWALSGDAGLFADPFYSPGSDFIAFSNSYICELIAREQPEATLGYQNELLSFFTNTLSLYRGQYGGFGDRDFMVAKTVWDYAYYWAVLSKLYFSGRFTDLRFMGEQKPNLLTASALNSGMQKQFREQARGRRRRGGEGRFFDHHSIVDFHRLKLELLRDAQRSDPAADAHELGNNVAWLQAMVPLVQRLARGEAAPELAGELRVSASQRRTEPTDTPVAPRPTPSDPVPRAAGY